MHLQKLSVGTESVEDLAAWQATRRAQTPDGLPRHVTRMWPKRAEELLSGGSTLLGDQGRDPLPPKGSFALTLTRAPTAIARCAIVLEPALTASPPTPAPPVPGLALNLKPGGPAP